MIRGTGLGRLAAHMGVACACALLIAFASAPAFALAPHVATTNTPDTCAMCHRAHTASGDFGRVEPGTQEMTSTALTAAVPLAAGDTALCYVCHGVDALGSGTPVGASFAQPSAHSLAPAESPFGPSVKYCSSCHDSHGTDEAAPGIPYAKLLRSRTATGETAFRGAAYCGACHTVRAESRFPGVSIYEQTAHFGNLPDPSSGTMVRCSICHEAHGSAVAPLIAEAITPPSVADTQTVTANDRGLCLTCHADALRTWSGDEAYADSAHGVSETTTTVPGEWPAEDASRRIGECQVCHAPMGRDDGEGAPIPALLEMNPTELCLSCHDTDGPAETDLVATTYPDAAAPDLELVAGFSAETTTAAFSTLAVWGTDPGDAPRTLVGPRFYRPAGTSGPMALGDVDGSGKTDVVAADTSFAQITVLSADPLKGLSSYYGPGTLVIDAIADYLVVADVIANSQHEICVISGSTLYVYRYDDLGVLQLLDTVTGLGADITGLASGDLDNDGLEELVITDAAATEIHVLTESITTPGTMVPLIPPIGAKDGVRSPSVGDVHAAAGVEIAVCNADEDRYQLSVYSASGLGLAAATLPIIEGSAAHAESTLIADVLPGIAGNELVAAIDGVANGSVVSVFPQLPAGGFDTRQDYTTGTRYRSGTLAAGDLDGDGHDELVVGNGGYWSRDPALATPPNIQVFQHNAGLTAFDVGLTVTLGAGGVERAGAAPSLAVADLGGVGPSRHPVGAVEDAHEADEAAPFVRHVECVDCHNSHEATSTVAAAPDVYGRILGTSGATAALAPVARTQYEYQLCYKCHSAYQNAAGLEGAKDISVLTDSGNASFHAVEVAASTSINAATFEPGWGSGSILYCTSCHSVAGAAPQVAGPHSSAEAPILRSPYLGVTPANQDGLCYDCHKYGVYYTGLQDGDPATGSAFRDSTEGPLHELHVEQQGFGCASCHDSHGSPTNKRLIRSAITFNATARTCTGPCHPGGISYTP